MENGEESFGTDGPRDENGRKENDEVGNIRMDLGTGNNR